MPGDVIYVIGWGVREGPGERKTHRYVGAQTHHMYAHSVLIHAHTETQPPSWTHTCTQVMQGARHMHAHMCTQVHTYTQIHTCTHRYTHADTCTQVHTQIYTCIQGRAHTGIHSAYVCTQIQARICIHVHTDAHMHTRYGVCTRYTMHRQRGGEKLGGGKQNPGKQ